MVELFLTIMIIKPINDINFQIHIQLPITNPID